MSGLSDAYRLQTTIVHALMMRGMHSRNAQSRMGLFLSFLEPGIMILAIFAIRWYISGGAPMFGIPLAVMVTTGFMPYYFNRMALNDAMNATRNKTPSLMFPSVTSLDNVLAVSTNAFVIYGAVMAMMFTLVATVFSSVPPHDLLKLIIAVILIMWVGVAMGVILGVAARIMPVLKLILPPLMRVTVLFSGAFFLAVELPQSALVYLGWWPLFVGIEIMREAWMEGYSSPVADMSYMIFITLLLTVVGLTLERRTRQFKIS